MFTFPQRKNRNSIQCGYWKCVTRARVLFPTIVHEINDEMRQINSVPREDKTLW